METKLSKIKAFAASGDWPNALRIAARFHDLGDHRAAILRGHEAYSNGAFYEQLGKNRAALIEAGIAALCDRYEMTQPMNERTAPMITTTKTAALSGMQIAQLTAILTGGGFKRANSREAAIKRFGSVFAEKFGENFAARDVASILAKPTLEEAKADLAAAMAAASAEIAHTEETAEAKAPKANIHAASNKLIADALARDPELAAMAKAPARVSKMAAIAAVQGEPKNLREQLEAAKAKRAVAAPKPAGKKAAILEAAQRGELPTAPDFTAETHAPHRKKLAAVVALIEARDIAGLKADPTEPKSSSRMAICRFRDLAIVALEAQAAAEKQAA